MSNIIKKTKTLLVIFILALTICLQKAVAQQIDFTRPTFKAKQSNKTPFWHIKVLEDENYIFVYRHYGNDNRTPGFFIFGKKQNKWIKVNKLSTENAKLGRSPSTAELTISVSWDYSYIKKYDYVDVNLQTTGSVNFPDNIEFDSVNQAYCFRYNSLLDREESLTTFWLLKKDIEKKFS